MNKKGFTLIELMIVIAIIAIIAAIAIPSLIKSKISANEGAAAGSLKTLNGMFATYKKKGYSYTGKRYPHGFGIPGLGATNMGTYSGLYYEVNNAGEQVTLIGAAEAGADHRADGDTDLAEDNGIYQGSTDIDGTPTWAVFAVSFSCKNKQGYWFGLFQGLSGTGGPYSYNLNESRNHYALQAVPADYGSSGENTYIINEEGTVYSLDLGNATAWQAWYPTVTPGLRNWTIAE